MNLYLTRLSFRDDGVWGELFDDGNNRVALTLEHSYPAEAGNGSYTAKLQPGTYTCKRGIHKLANLIPFETFEIEGVKRHDNILFHPGNYNKDSHGCVLLGTSIARIGKSKDEMLTASKAAFDKFMNLQKNINEFTLTVSNQ